MRVVGIAATLLLVTAGCSAAGPALARPATPVADAELWHLSEAEGCSGNIDISFGDLDGDGADEAAFVQECESAARRVRVYRDGPVLVPPVPTSIDDVWSTSITRGRLEVTGASHAADDPSCCPSIGVRETFRLRGDVLVLDRSGARPPADDGSAAWTRQELLDALVPGGVCRDEPGRLVDGVEHVEFRLDVRTYPDWVATGDLDGDGLADGVSIVVCESMANRPPRSVLFYGSNARASMPVVLPLGRAQPRDSGGGPFPYEIAIDGGELVTESSVHLPDDAGCCPSAVASTRLRLEGGSWVRDTTPGSVDGIRAGDDLAAVARAANGSVVVHPLDGMWDSTDTCAPFEVLDAEGRPTGVTGTADGDWRVRSLEVAPVPEACI